MQTSGVNRHSEQLRNDNPNFSHSLCDLTPWWFSTAKPISVLLFKTLSISLFVSVSVLTILCPLFVFIFLFFFFSFSTPLLCLSFRLSAAQSPTVTDPLQQAYAGVQHYAGDLSLLSPLLSHFLHLSLSLSPSPFLFVTSVDTLTGRDSQTSQFPPGLGYFALGLQRDLQLTRLYTHTQKKNLNSKSTLRAEDLNLP